MNVIYLTKKVLLIHMNFRDEFYFSPSIHRFNSARESILKISKILKGIKLLYTHSKLHRVQVGNDSNTE